VPFRGFGVRLFFVQGDKGFKIMKSSKPFQHHMKVLMTPKISENGKDPHVMILQNKRSLF
jgi:hypothetical protein